MWRRKLEIITAAGSGVGHQQDSLYQALADLEQAKGITLKSPASGFSGSGNLYLEHGDLREQSFEDRLWVGSLEGFSFPGDSCVSWGVAGVEAGSVCSPSHFSVLCSLGLCLGQAQFRRPQGSAGSSVKFQRFLKGRPNFG